MLRIPAYPCVQEFIGRVADSAGTLTTGPHTVASAPDVSARFVVRGRASAPRCGAPSRTPGADATLAVGAEYTVDTEVALDGIDEWMTLCALPMRFDIWMRELLGPGRTLHFHATGTPPEASAEWSVDLTGAAITGRRAHEKAAVAVRGPPTDLLLICKRISAPTERVEVIGDERLLEFWLERVSFG